MNGRVSIAMLLTLAACGSSTTPESANPARTPTCEERVSRLEEQLRELPDGSGADVPDGIEAPSSASGAPVPVAAPIVAIDARRAMSLDGRPIASQADLVRDLETLRAGWTILHPAEPYPAEISIWADRALTLADVHGALSEVNGHRLVILAVDPTLFPLPPCPSTLEETCTRLTSLDREARLREIARAWPRAIGTCAPMIALFDAIAGSTTERRSAMMRSGLPSGLRECGCADGTDADAIAYLAAVTNGPAFQPRVLGRELPPASESDARTTVGAWR